MYFWSASSICREEKTKKHQHQTETVFVIIVHRHMADHSPLPSFFSQSLMKITSGTSNNTL